ncbi:SGNH/GDSL hydrolase family protein [Leifsonia soli]|uniref:Lysophospholipase L1-like esterase n=1 Tax=Leifsonia soli TaxID=582665 RepID=A0A852T2H0_9MICO|nr:SGNH/GDSL hydrolase family protein [Leifsonia soli]NYD75075.1 lysophospholipase L1-like esterase [Leifsonia soli]
MTQRLVFAGDSITDAGRDRSDDRSLGDGYVAMIAAELAAQGADAVVINRGIAGDRAADLERRWERDVLAEHPDVLTVYVGVNDMWRRFDSDDPTTAAAFEATYRRLLEPLEAGPLATGPLAAGPLVLIEPYFVPVHAEQRGWLDDLDEKRAGVARLARETGASLVLLHDRMTRAADENGTAAIAPDGVHPTPAGSRIIADAWLAAFSDVSPAGTQAGARR